MKKVATSAEMIELLADDGSTEVKLLGNVYETRVSIATPCTIDFNGFTWTGHTSDGTLAGNALNLKTAVGEVVTLKNGTVYAAVMGVAVDTGGVLLDNMTIRSTGGANVGVRTSYKENSVVIKNSRLLSDVYLNIGFYGVDHSENTTVYVENSDLVAFKPDAGNVSLDKNGSAKCGTVEFGYNVRIYSGKADYKSNNPNITGKKVLVAESKATYEVDGTPTSALNLWYTEPLATVQTGDTVVNVGTVADMVAAIDTKGNSTVTLYGDATFSGRLDIPVCTIDLNGHTLVSTDNSVLNFDSTKTDAAAENFYSVVKNGTLHGKTSAIRYDVGGLRVTNCQLRGDGANTIQCLESSSTGAYNDGNIIENSTLISTITAPLGFNRKNKDFSQVTFKIENCDLINSTAAGGVVFGKTSGVTSGTFELGENVNLYTYKTDGYAGSGVNVSGTATKLSGTYAVEALGQNYTGLTRWTTESLTAPTVTTPVNGTVSLEPAQAYSGQEVTVVATADEGYEVDTITVNGEPISGVTFTMPKGGATVEVTFKKSGAPAPAPVIQRPTYHGITIETVTGGVVKASAEKATINTVIDLEIIPEAGYVLESITVKKLYNGKNATVTDNSFYMPYSNVVITPVFKQAG